LKKDVVYFQGIGQLEKSANPRQHNVIWSITPCSCYQSQSMEGAEEGLVTHLREFGFVKLFRKVFKKEDSRHYIFYQPDSENPQEILQQIKVSLFNFMIHIGALKVFIEQ
jgi:hypothetical protein